MLAAGALASIRHLKQSDTERQAIAQRAAMLKQALADAGLPVMESPSHIVPLFVGNAGLCKSIADQLLAEHGIYVQPINYPTVPRGGERLRLTPSPAHSPAMIGALVDAITAVWDRHQLSRAA